MSNNRTWDIIISIKKKEEAEKRLRARQEIFKKKNQEKEEIFQELG